MLYTLYWVNLHIKVTMHALFPTLLTKYHPTTPVKSIDHPSNGLLLWVAIRRLWDKDQAAISPHSVSTRPIAHCSFMLNKISGIDTATSEVSALCHPVQ
jgi:hypothetical protein